MYIYKLKINHLNIILNIKIKKTINSVVCERIIFHTIDRHKIVSLVNLKLQCIVHLYIKYGCVLSFFLKTFRHILYF
jgi:hypothetical protein